MRHIVTFVTGSTVVWGAETSMLTLAQAMRLDVDVRLICSSQELAERWKSTVGPNVTVIASRPGRLGRVPAFAQAIRMHVADASTIVLFDYYLLPAVAVLRPWLSRRRVRLVVDVHDSARNNARRKPYFWIMAIADHLIVVSQYLAEEMPRNVGVSVVHRPIQIPAPPIGTARHADPTSVAIVGQITPAKRVEEAVGILEHSDNLHLEVRGAPPAGGNEYLTKVLKRGAAFGSRFTFRGRVPADEALQGISFLLLTNPAEPFGRVVAEAQLQGVVPVVPSTGGASELVDHGDNGLIYPPLDTQSAAQMIESVIANPLQHGDMLARAREHARKSYDPSVIGKAYINALGLSTS